MIRDTRYTPAENDAWFTTSISRCFLKHLDNLGDIFTGMSSSQTLFFFNFLSARHESVPHTNESSSVYRYTLEISGFILEIAALYHTDWGIGQLSTGDSKWSSGITVELMGIFRREE